MSTKFEKRQLYYYYYAIFVQSEFWYPVGQFDLKEEWGATENAFEVNILSAGVPLGGGSGSPFLGLRG